VSRISRSVTSGRRVGPARRQVPTSFKRDLVAMREPPPCAMPTVTPDDRSAAFTKCDVEDVLHHLPDRYDMCLRMHRGRSPPSDCGTTEPVVPHTDGWYSTHRPQSVLRPIGMTRPPTRPGPPTHEDQPTALGSSLRRSPLEPTACFTSSGPWESRAGQ
jgi:hypothetical protein